MNAIKYLSSLLECSEIILESVSADNTMKFYKSQKFIDIESLLPYHNFKYIVSNEDKRYQHPIIEGNTNVILEENDEDIDVLKSSPVLGGKSKRRKLKKKNTTIKKLNKIKTKK